MSSKFSMHLRKLNCTFDVKTQMLKQSCHLSTLKPTSILLPCSNLLCLKQRKLFTKHCVGDGKRQHWSPCHPPTRSEVSQLCLEHLHNHLIV